MPPPTIYHYILLEKFTLSKTLETDNVSTLKSPFVSSIKMGLLKIIFSKNVESLSCSYTLLENMLLFLQFKLDGMLFELLRNKKDNCAAS